MDLSRENINVNFKAEYSRKKSITMHFVWYERYAILWVAKTQGNCNFWALSKIIDTFSSMSDEIEQKRPYTGKKTWQVILLHENARPRAAIATKQFIDILGWEVLPHADYFLDMAPPDFPLFSSLQHYLVDTHFQKPEV